MLFCTAIEFDQTRKKRKGSAKSSATETPNVNRFAPLVNEPVEEELTASCMICKEMSKAWTVWSNAKYADVGQVENKIDKVRDESPDKSKRTKEIVVKGLPENNERGSRSRQ